MLQYADRTQETTSITGTEAYLLNGPVAGYRPFSATCENNDTCFYSVTDGVNWEVGLGTYNSSTNTLARTAILSSSNGDAIVSWAYGQKNIWIDVPAQYFTQNSQTREVTVTGAITQLSTDRTIVVENNGSTGVDVNLLPSSQSGILTVADGTGNGAANPYNLVPADGEVIDGADSLSSTYDWQATTLTPIAAGWKVTA